MIQIERGDGVDGVVLGVVRASSVSLSPAPPELADAVEGAVVRAAERDDTEPVRAAVRDMLRWGKYKPTGRAKPASEYLLGAAREGRFPRINGLVDLNNLVSLETLLPISVVDVARAGTESFLLRRGREGEKYTFNAAGHEIELRDLLLVASSPDDAPCANAVKDSMRTKVHDETTEVVAFIYGPVVLADLVGDAVERFADGVRRWCGAAEASGGTW